MTNLSVRQAVLGLLLAAVYFLGLLTFKEYAYPGWSWRGFIGDYRALLALAATLAAPIAYLWTLYRRQGPLASFAEFLRRALMARRLNGAIGGAAFLALSLGAALHFIPESRFPDLDSYLAQHNWSYAEQALETLREKPIRSDLLFSYEHYIDAHRRSDGNEYGDGALYREQRAAVAREIALERGVPLLNVLTLAELSKIIYFVEDRDEEELAAAIALLDERARTAPSGRSRSAFQQKVGDLYLAQRRYEEARAAYESIEPVSDVQAAEVSANLGNILASTGDPEAAIEYYQRAEAAYPAGRRAVFYSNYGYLLMLADRHAEAERRVLNALAIDREDWYSYLNLALIFDALGRHDDAVVNYDIVLANAAHLDFVREARLLKAYSLLRAGSSEIDAIREVLTALGRSTNDVDAIAADETRRSEVYRSAADALLDVNTHGIERYIRFFRDRASGSPT